MHQVYTGYNILSWYSPEIPIVFKIVIAFLILYFTPKTLLNFGSVFTLSWCFECFLYTGEVYMNTLLKTIIIDIAPLGLSDAEMQHRMDELESLVSTYGGVTIVRRVQKRITPDYRTFVGSGKLDELVALGDELGAELLIIGNIMKPAQVWNVNEHLRKAKSKMQAWDRVDLILKIFSLHAVSPESQLQIELAAIKHMGPRIFGMGMELSRQ